MNLRTITFQVDTSDLFDALVKMNGDTGPLGARLVSALLADPCIADRLAMGLYGVALLTEASA